jgi:hypothetical protein
MLPTDAFAAINKNGLPGQLIVPVKGIGAYMTVSKQDTAIRTASHSTGKTLHPYQPKQEGKRE